MSDRCSRWIVVLLSFMSFAVLTGVLAPSALGTTVAGPKHTMSTVTLRVTPSAEESGAIGLLVMDGEVVARCTLTYGRPVVLRDVPMRFRGIHRLRMVVRRSRAGRVSNLLKVQSWGRPQAPVLLSPSPGSAASKDSEIRIRTGRSTAGVSLYLNGKFVRSIDVDKKGDVSLGRVSLGKGRNTIRLVAGNPCATTKVDYTVQRLDYPWATCIVIDKSDFKLYWVKDGVLVKTYPVAIGKPSSETPVATWRIGDKYITDARGVYGPRKMRLYRKTGSSFARTAYNIHGTNQPWVIGTKASHGCIRMYNSDVLDLFPRVPLGTMVLTRY